VPAVDVIVVGDSSSDENVRPSSPYSVSDSSSPRPRYQLLASSSTELGCKHPIPIYECYQLNRCIGLSSANDQPASP